MKALTYFFLSMTIISLLFSCSGSDSSSSSSGNISIQLTDAPFPSDLVSEANVTIDKIEIRRSDDSDGNPFIILSEIEHSFNLLELTNGVTESLVDMEIEEGSYDLIRLYIAEASVVLSDGTEYNLTVPSGDETGIKIFIAPSIDVVEGLTADLLLDCDVSQSFVVQGNPDSPAGINGFIFKPTIKAANLSTSGKLVGTITDVLGQPIERAIVSVSISDTLYTSTLTDESGEYAILGLSAGTYNIDVDHGDYSSVQFDDVEITSGNVTNQDAQLTQNIELE
jgi:hypothetical protein